MISAKLGVPPNVLTVSTSLKVTVAKRVSVALRLLIVASLTLAIEPEALVNATLLMIGAKVSMLITGVVPALPVLPALSL